MKFLDFVLFIIILVFVCGAIQDKCSVSYYAGKQFQRAYHEFCKGYYSENNDPTGMEFWSGNKLIMRAK
jgi:hypothetical protein